MLIDRKSISAEIVTDFYKYLWDEYGALPMGNEVSAIVDSGDGHWNNTYRFNAAYLGSTVRWDRDERKQHIYDTIEAIIPRNASVLDLGCASGITGLTLIKLGYTDVSFCDFHGIGERFIKYELGQWGMKRPFIEYGQEQGTKFSWVLACDVVEHVSNPLTFLQWVYDLCVEGAVITYPNIPWSPPYVSKMIDMHIDTDLFLLTATKLFKPYTVFKDHDGVEIVFLRRYNE